MSYIGEFIGEFRAHWHNLFEPALIAGVVWTKAQFSLIGVLPLATLLVILFRDRLAEAHEPAVALQGPVRVLTGAEV